MVSYLAIYRGKLKLNLNKWVVLSWVANITVVLATITTALDIIPLNKVLFFFSCVLWTIVGMHWRQPSLWSLNMFCGLVYIVGMFK